MPSRATSESTSPRVWIPGPLADSAASWAVTCTRQTLATALQLSIVALASGWVTISVGGGSTGPLLLGTTCDRRRERFAERVSALDRRLATATDVYAQVSSVCWQ